MHRGISAGIILSVVLMTYYQIFVDDEDYGILPNFYHTACVVVLVIGSEVRDRIQSSYKFVITYAIFCWSNT